VLAAAAALLLASASGALPPPPQKVVFKASKGDVTFDHAAHLARRTHCVECHGPGVVGKLEGFEMQRAHMLCVGCHRERAHGPIICKDCHGAGANADAPAEASQ
jgi:DnaJ-class molecular chaperone